MRPRWILPLLLLWLASASGAADVRVRYADGALWVSSRGVPVPDLFSVLARRTGIRFSIDPAIPARTVTIEIEGMELERAIRNLLSEIPEVSGHTMTYARGQGGVVSLTEVAIYGPGSPGPLAPAGGERPSLSPLPDPEERLQRMVEAGVPRNTAERVLALTEEARALQATPAPGSYDPDDLSPESREQLPALLDRGVSMERAVQMLLLQERYRETLGELSDLRGEPRDAGAAPATPDE